MRTTPFQKAVKQVLRGIAFLDEHGPRNWRSFVNLDNLLMNNCRTCILGQLFADYWIGVSLLRLENPQRYGFYFDGTISSGVLADAWKALLGRAEKT